MSNKAQKLVRDLLFIYAKENYNIYLKEHKLEKIPEAEIRNVISGFYINRKDHIKNFLKESLVSIMEEDYIGDLFVNNICNEIFSDDELCINRLTLEINNYQKNL